MNHAELVMKASSYLKKAGLNDGQVEMLVSAGYMRCPASRKNHLARPGGLAEHSMNVVEQLLALNVFADDKSAYRVGMLHDLVKLYNYRLNADLAYDKVAAHYPGHGTASALICADLGIELTNEERQAIVWHMGAFGIKDRETNDAYDAAKRLFPRAIVMTRAADHLASELERAAEEE